MSWITFAYSLPKTESSTRVTLWRRLQRLGAVAPAGNLYVLPNLPDCTESFQWLTQEIQQKGGQAIMSQCEQFEGMSNEAIVGLFCEARGKEYEKIRDEIAKLELALTEASEEDMIQLPAQIGKLRRQFADVARIDYFDCEEAQPVLARLNGLEARLSLGDQAVGIEVKKTADFTHKTWTTRPQPHVDRLSSIWLIRRFIDPQATIRYSKKPKKSEISFDMPDAHFGHTGNLCTFETFIATFQIKTDGLAKLAEIIHEIDLHDGLYNHPETIGIDAILQGWLKQDLSDEDLETRGLMLFDGLLASLKPSTSSKI